MPDRSGKIQVKTRTQVTDLLRDLNRMSARQADAWLPPKRVADTAPRYRAPLYFTTDGQLVVARPRGKAGSSRLARAGVITFFVLVAAACGALLG